MKDLYICLKQTFWWYRKKQIISFTPMKETQETNHQSEEGFINTRTVYPPNWGGKRDFNKWADKLPNPSPIN